MFERYTERARRVLFFARYEASQLGSISIETEHLLLGLIREGKGLTSRVFARSRLSLEGVRKEIEGHVVFREKTSTSVEIPFSAETKRVLQYAADEADRMLHNYIGTEHLLLGILREERSVAASILMDKGMRLESVREDIAQLLSDKTTLTRVKETLGAGSIHVIHGPEPGDIPGVPWYLPSDTVHISISRRDDGHAWSSEGPQHWIMVGTELKSVLARAYGTDEEHLNMPAALVDGSCLDVVLVLPREESEKTRMRIVQQALERQFRLTVSREPGPNGVDLVVIRQSPA